METSGDKLVTTQEAASKPPKSKGKKHGPHAKVKSADQVALEADNSPSIIFKHYRELTTEDEADKWFGILTKPGQWENTFHYDRQTRTVTLPKSTGS